MPEQMAFPFEILSKFNIGDKCVKGKRVGEIHSKMKHPKNPEIWMYYFVSVGKEVNDQVRIWCEEKELRKAI